MHLILVGHDLGHDLLENRLLYRLWLFKFQGAFAIVIASIIDPMAFEFKLTVPDLVGEGEDVSTIVESPPASGDSKLDLLPAFGIRENVRLDWRY